MARIPYADIEHPDARPLAAEIAAQRADLLAEHGARPDFELRCISQVDPLP